MNKLERLLKKVDQHNDPAIGTIESYKEECRQLGSWVYLLWRRGDLKRDVANMKLKGGMKSE
jgi:hypothetical protein